MNLRAVGGPLHDSVRDIPEEAIMDGGFIEFMVEEDGKPSRTYVYRIEVRPFLYYMGEAGREGHTPRSPLLLPP